MIREEATGSKQSYTLYLDAVFTDYAEVISTGDIDLAIKYIRRDNLERHFDWWTCTVDSDDKNKVYVAGHGIGFEPFLQISHYLDAVCPVIQLDVSKAEYSIIVDK